MISTNIEDYDPSTLTFSSSYIDYEGNQHPESGEFLTNQEYFISASAPNGVKWHRNIGVSDWVIEIIMSDNGEMIPIAHRSIDPSILQNCADKLAKKLTECKTPKLNPQVWRYAEAIYGSEAYSLLNIEDELTYMESTDIYPKIF